jgi:acetylornithine deacetylase/succinyl-diaminopimelate desuccinylase-like protein
MPGAVNVIPSAAQFTIDIRSPRDQVRSEAIARLSGEMEAIAARRGVELHVTRSYDAAAATCAPWLVGRLEEAVGRSGIRPLRLPSGAGHDGLAMIGLCPIGMLFVRCRDGISHNPAESITIEDADDAVRVLIEFLSCFQPQPH